MGKLEKAARMALKVGSTKHVALWDAINDLVVASGGRNSVSTARMLAVAAVEKALRAALAEHAAEREALTDDQIVAIRDSMLPGQGEAFDCIAFARAIESEVRK